MANLERAGWLGLTLASCSALVLLLGVAEGRGPARTRPLAGQPGREHAQVRGRPVVLAENAWDADAVAIGPRRPAAGTRTRCEPQAAEDGAETGRVALSGRITRDGRGVQARIRFELGWNQGREVATSPDGAFSCRSLCPGFQRVTVAVEGRPACTRPLFLEPYRAASLQLDFGAPCARQVRVLDPEGRALPGAVVELDGETTTTDAAGRAQLVSVCSGAPELVVRAAHCAWFACALERSDAELPEAEFTVQLDRACTLELSLPALARPDEAVVYLLPRDPGRFAGRPPRPATPWYLASPLHLASGASVRLENLPVGELEIRTFHPGARLATERVILEPERPLALTLRATAVAPDGRPDPGSLRGLLSSTGLGELPRLQPLELPMAGGRFAPLRRASPAPTSAAQ